jgi:catechol 2,3-dioxygenase-like lactoylglutathione lyase family enzyme
MTGMSLSLQKMSVITVFAEDLAGTKAFYQDVLGLEVLGEETNEFGPSVVFKLGGIMINLAHVTAGPDFGAPGAVAARGEGARVVLPAGVADVDEACAELARLGVPLLDEPRDRPWGIRCASFVDPAGHIWEIVSDID